MKRGKENPNCKQVPQKKRTKEKLSKKQYKEFSQNFTLEIVKLKRQIGLRSLLFNIQRAMFLIILILEIINITSCVHASSVGSSSLPPYVLQPARLLCPWDFPGKNTGVSCHFFLQRIFLTQISNPHLLCLLHCRKILYHLSHRGINIIYMSII